MSDSIGGNFDASQIDWPAHFELTKDGPPSPLLVKAMEYVARKGAALDLGDGALKDARFLLGAGFDVTVVDKEPWMARAAEAIASDKLHVLVSSFAEFDFPKEAYELASAMFALPFNPPDTFDAVFQRIKNALVKDGVFCGQFFGVRDGWAGTPSMTFHTKEQAERLLTDGMELISFVETEKDSRTADGALKHWHLFHVIARKW